MTFDEKALLLRHLNGARQHVLGALDGLDDAALQRPVLPSGWSPVGLVHHLALDDERFWFAGTVAGERSVIDDVAASAELPQDAAWHPPADLTPADVLRLYRDEITRSNAIIDAIDLDAPPAWWPEDLFGDYRLHSLREVIMHVITETATHAGHIDAARELIDGRQWLVLD